MKVIDHYLDDWNLWVRWSEKREGGLYLLLIEPDGIAESKSTQEHPVMFLVLEPISRIILMFYEFDFPKKFIGRAPFGWEADSGTGVTVAVSYPESGSEYRLSMMANLSLPEDFSSSRGSDESLVRLAERIRALFLVVSSIRACIDS